MLINNCTARSIARVNYKRSLGHGLTLILHGYALATKNQTQKIVDLNILFLTSLIFKIYPQHLKYQCFISVNQWPNIFCITKAP